MPFALLFSSALSAIYIVPHIVAAEEAVIAGVEAVINLF